MHEKKEEKIKKHVNLTINCCVECPYHGEEDDSDLYDWFRDGDWKLVCKRTKRQNNAVARSIEPFDKVKKILIPKWCPLRKRR